MKNRKNLMPAEDKKEKLPVINKPASTENQKKLAHASSQYLNLLNKESHVLFY